MKVGRGSGEDLEEEEEKDLDPSSNLTNAKISRSLKSSVRRNEGKEGIKNTNRYAV